ncbi:hypothetical protein EYF80_060966 [Liparis tanakae]|uniref:Uncharacterized protein n=1 Tax=Liparis tanakae TaxID=230148 RepID=A0A4Z2EIV7_9TELE|nr:hypothetical protein EYF80_060966 [Liparis tanakae]
MLLQNQSVEPPLEMAGQRDGETASVQIKTFSSESLLSRTCPSVVPHSGNNGGQCEPGGGV